MKVNPIIRREFLSSLRSIKIFILVMVYVLFLTLVAGIFLAASDVTSTFNPRQAIYLYSVLAGFQLFLAMLIIPALAGSTISGERERQTLDLLLITKMSPISIIWGKLVSSLLVSLLIILSSMPIFGLILFYGGVSVINIMGMIVFTIITTAMGGSVAIFFSALFKKTVGAIILSYIVYLSITLGNFITFLLIGGIPSSLFGQSLPPGFYKLMLGSNPAFSFLSVLDSQFGFNNINSIANSFSYDMLDIPVLNAISDVLMFIPPWLTGSILNLLVTALLILLSSKLINPLKKN